MPARSPPLLRAPFLPRHGPPASPPFHRLFGQRAALLRENIASQSPALRSRLFRTTPRILVRTPSVLPSGRISAAEHFRITNHQSPHLTPCSHTPSIQSYRNVCSSQHRKRAGPHPGGAPR